MAIEQLLVSCLTVIGAIIGSYAILNSKSWIKKSAERSVERVEQLKEEIADLLAEASSLIRRARFKIQKLERIKRQARVR